MEIYAQKIKDTLSYMYSIIPDIRIENAFMCHNYLRSIDRDVSVLQLSLDNPRDCDKDTQKLFQSFVDSEEEKLRGRLESLAYNVDTVSAFLIGPGKIEKVGIHNSSRKVCSFDLLLQTLLPLLYLLLSRHFKIFLLARTEVLDGSEFRDLSTGISQLINEAESRVLQLKCKMIHHRPWVVFNSHFSHL